MKKVGFTLAELLITLSIIGVSIAMITPAVSNLMPDINKAKVIKYNARINNAITKMFNDETVYHPMGGREGPICIPDFRERLIEDLDIDANGNAIDGSSWVIEDITGAGDSFNITIDVKPNEEGCSYSENCAIRDLDTFLFRIDTLGNVLARDPLTDAYLRNPLNMNSKKEDLDTAKSFLDANKNY